MRLTNTMKDAIVRAVMDDVPEQYSFDQCVKDAISFAVEKLPSKIRSIWDDKTTREYVRVSHYGGIGAYLPILPNVTYPEINALAERRKLSEKTKNELRKHVKNVVYQFSTDKQMRELIPELAKYIPKAPAVVTANLPVSNMIAELSRAGWPKGGSV